MITLRTRNLPPAQAKERIERWAAKLGLRIEEGRKLPKTTTTKN